MERDVNELPGLGARLRKLQEDGLAVGHDLLAARDRFLATARPARRTAAAPWVLAFVLPSALVLAFVLRGSPRSARTAAAPFMIGAGRIGQLEVPLVGGAGVDGAMRFPDGSTVLLRPNAIGRVAATTDTGARVVLMRGEAVVSVTKQPHASWVFEAGPFHVAVTGTQFDLGWEEAGGRFWLQMREGSVLISGPGIQGSRPARAGERVELAWAEHPAARPGSQIMGEPPRLESVPSAASPSVARGAAPTGAASRRVTWLDLVRAGRFGRAIERAEADGYDGLLEHLGAADLMALGNAARYANNPTRAKQAYGALRRRFSNDPDAAVAAFYLGRFAFPAPESADWFSVYLREQPHGTLRREALGRLLETRAYGPDATGTEDLARRYLGEYPDGPHASVARKLLERDGTK